MLFASARFYWERSLWGLPVFLLMPDHVHMLATFGPDASMKKVIRNWKRYAANHAGIHWQRDFFDHRLRDDESYEEKAAYVLHNPVRAGLVTRWEDWPYRIHLR